MSVIFPCCPDAAYITHGDYYQQAIDIPLGFRACTLNIERDGVKYRQKFNGEITFVGWVFTYIAAIELSADRCQEIIVGFTCDGETWWEGFFAPSMGVFDFDACAFTVTPLPVDSYKEFVIDNELQYNVLDGTPITLTLVDYPVYDNCRDWMEMIRAVVAQIDSTLTVVSTLFENTISPLTGLANAYRYLAIAQKSDIVNPAGDNATEGFTTFEEVMTWCRVLFQAYYEIDGTIFRLEHISYFQDATGSVDLRGLNGESRKSKFRYDQSELPSEERVMLMAGNWSQAGFPWNYVTYDKSCAKGAPVETQIKITTDIYDIKEGYDTSNEGFVLFGCTGGGASRTISTGMVSYYPTGAANNLVAMPTLIDNFWRHDRPFRTGYVIHGNILSTEETFLSAKRQRLQELFIASGVTFDPRDEFETSLGDILGQTGRLRSAELSTNGGARLELEYGDEPTPTPSLVGTFEMYSLLTQTAVANDTLNIYVVLNSAAPVGGITINVGYKFTFDGGTDCDAYGETVAFLAGATTSGDSPITIVAGGRITVNTIEIDGFNASGQFERTGLQPENPITC